ncbi:MAG: hypothetical protein D6772_12685, partial [Bacteroidetes bacterium]
MRKYGWLISALIGIGLSVPERIAGDCGPGGWGFYGYSFINPKIIDFEAEWAPLFLDIGQIYTDYFKSEAEQYRLNNAQEWQARYCEKAELEDIEYILYTASRYDLEDLRAVMNDPKAQLHMLGAVMANNSWVRYVHRHNCMETVNYLVYAKRCEPFVTGTDPWQLRQRDASDMLRLADEAMEHFLRTESHYIKLRYAFQAIRLAHYAREYDLTLELVDYYLPKLDNDPSLVDYWIMGHQAGALLAKGERARSAYLYSRVFEHCPSKRESAFRSFRIKTDEEWRDALLMCKNDHERATLHAMRAATDDAQLLEEMQQIYAYDPQHPALEMLLVRELQKLEKDLLGAAFNPQRKRNKIRYGIPRDYAEERVIALQSLVRQWEKEGLVRQPALWKLAEGYLEVLAGDFYFASKTLEEAAEIVKDKDLREQLAVFRLVLDILALDEADPGTEEFLADIPRKFKYYESYPDFSKLIRDKLRLLYRQEGEGSKAYLMEYGLRQLRIKPEPEIIDELIFLCQKEERSEFEDKLVLNDDGETILYDLLDVKAALYMRSGALESALEVMKDIPPNERDLYGLYNPFVRRFKDCVHCPLPDSVTTFNRLDLIEELLDIEYQARAESDPDKAAALYFDLGEAFYNMTYFGNSWRAMDAFRSGSSAARAYRDKGQTVFSYPGLPLGNEEYFNCETARRYFDLARRTAQDREVKAAAAYMGAKCERNEFYVRSKVRTFDYFTILQEEY